MVPAPVTAAYDALSEGKVSMGKRKTADYTNSSANTTIFDVWGDFLMIKGLKQGRSTFSRAHQLSDKRHSATV
jgi:hypothetical protein